MPPAQATTITRTTVLCLGLSQLICWGVSYYLIGAFGDAIAAELGWSPSLVHGGFSAALLAMGVASPLVGRAIDSRGGRPVMAAGSVLTALGCAGLALAHKPLTYYAAWLCLGLAMRMTLYDAAFAALARIGGPLARRPISQITLLGGLASTVFWPIGHYLAEATDWRTAVWAYAGFALLTLPLHLAIPPGRHREAPAEPDRDTGAPAAQPRDQILPAALYALIVTLTAFLNSAMSAHMIAILAGLGLATSVAVWIATLRGIAQSLARFAEILFGARLHPLALAVLATALLPICFTIGLFSGSVVGAAIVFAFLYGAGNGLATIVRGTLPLALFDPRTYGAHVGRLLVPSFVLSALAPVIYAAIIERFGDAAALHLSTSIAALTFAAALTLQLRFRRRASPAAGIRR